MEAPADIDMELVRASVRERLFGEARRPVALGRFLVLKRIGAGAMGVVYAAYDPELDRRVALKVLRSASSDRSEDDLRARLLREAKAAARLSHPNVVTVHDVGTHEGHVFLAMEYLDGGTLGQWLGAAERSWRDVVAVLLDAGRGLAAAHDAGLVHRDFKPENVLMDRDGNARVADFGLVGAVPAGDAPEPAGEPPPSTLGPDRLTRTGALLGTPRYMAPEQLLGKGADARSDQFSFCAVAWEALWAEPPFAGESLAELRDNVSRGAVRRPRAGRRVPAWVRRVLARGLSPEAGSRHPTMRDLLRELAPARRRARNARLAAAAVAAAVVAGIAALWVADREPAVCTAAQERLAGIWDPARREHARLAFEATKLPYAAASWRGASAALDRYARAWADTYRTSCEATHVRGEQSAELLDLRTACLERRRTDLQATTDLLVEADGDVVTRALRIVSSMPEVGACSDLDALKTRGRLPADPAARAVLQRAEPKLAQTRALLAAGRYGEGMDLAREVVREVGPTGHRRTQAEALLMLGLLELEAGHPDTAETDLFEAVAAATAAGDEETVARAATALVEAVGRRQLKIAEAHRWDRIAQAAIEHLGGDPLLEAERLDCVGEMMLDAELRREEAVELLRRAVELRAAAPVPDAARLAESLAALGGALAYAAELAEAEPIQQRALALRKEALGEQHPDVAESLVDLGLLRFFQDRNEDAADYWRRAIAIMEPSLGPDHHSLAMALNNLGWVLTSLGHHEEALPLLERAAGVLRAGPEIRGLDEALESMGRIRLLQGDADAALALFEESVAFLGREQRGAGTSNLGRHLLWVGRAKLALGRPREAVDDLGRLLSGPEASDLLPCQTAEILHAIAMARLQLDDVPGAEASLERALDCGAETVAGAHVRFALAWVLREREPQRARVLAEQARETLARPGTAGEADLVPIDAFLADPLAAPPPDSAW